MRYIIVVFDCCTQRSLTLLIRRRKGWKCNGKCKINLLTIPNNHHCTLTDTTLLPNQMLTFWMSVY